MTGKGWFDLILAATGDREQAERAEFEYLRAAQKRGETPATGD